MHSPIMKATMRVVKRKSLMNMETPSHSLHMMTCLSRDRRRTLIPRRNNPDISRVSEPSTKLRCARTGNSRVSASLKRVALLLMELMNLILSQTFPKTTKLNFANASMRSYIAPMDLDANLNIKKSRVLKILVEHRLRRQRLP